MEYRELTDDQRELMAQIIAYHTQKQPEDYYECDFETTADSLEEIAFFAGDVDFKVDPDAGLPCYYSKYPAKEFWVVDFGEFRCIYRRTSG
jgi:hypothetical protein